MTRALDDLSKVRTRNPIESALDYAIRLSDWYINLRDLRHRKPKGQFFTPKQVSIFMANLFDIRGDNFEVLDAGAGIGILSASFCNRILDSPKKLTFSLDAYENDFELLPLLRSVLETCKSEMKSKGHSLSYRIHNKDFILQNQKYLQERSLTTDLGMVPSYDYIISNPPYYKLRKDSPQAVIMRKLISGHPNIYALFMAMSARMLKSDGEMVFITPRSFCSGLYYKRFREWFLKAVDIKHIHIFESRKDVFEKDDVLQENIILKAKPARIRISLSKTKSMEGLEKIEVAVDDVMFRKNGNLFLRIPTSSSDIRIMRMVDRWPNTLMDLGLETSTGPVVVFRTKENLLYEMEELNRAAPLLWMHNFGELKVEWPIDKGKPIAIAVNNSTKPLLLPVRNYVLVKRFSSKEQKRRIFATVLLKEEFPYPLVGIENHVNYIHKAHGELSVCESLGLAGLLNTTLVDNYFRTFNGNTQVNATYLRSLPIPDMEAIRGIGKNISRELLSRDGHSIDFDEITLGVPGIQRSIRRNLGRG